MTKRTLLIAALLALAACPPTAPYSGGYSAGPTYVENTKYVGAAKRNHVMTEERAVEGVEVTVLPLGAAAWHVEIRNNTEGSMSIIWDESSFVASSGVVAGRLLRGETRKIDSAKAQPPSPVPPGTAARETILAEKFASEEEFESKYAEQSYPVELARRFAERRKRRNGLLLGGKLHLVLSTDDGKKTWTGLVTKKPAGLGAPAE